MNYAGSGIFGWDVSDLRSNDLKIKNLYMHDLKHSGNEVVGLSKNKKRFIVNTLLAPLNLEHLLGSMDVVKEWIYDGYVDDGEATDEDIHHIMLVILQLIYIYLCIN